MLSECENRNDAYKKNPQRSRQSDSKCAGRFNQTFVKPRVKPDDVRGKNNPPQPESRRQRETQIVTRFHLETHPPVEHQSVFER
jgi:hypothetical protein